MKRAGLIVGLLAVIALADPVVNRRLLTFNNGSAQHVVTATGACTTTAISIGEFPFVSLFGQVYTNTNTGDSAAVDIFYQVGDTRKRFLPQLDTVKVGIFGLPDDTLRTRSTIFGAELYPPVSMFLRFIVRGRSENGDSTYVDSLALCGQSSY